jgi:hypothetical protein
LSIDDPTPTVEVRDEFFGSVLEVAGGGSIAVGSVRRPIFPGIGTACWSSELVPSVCAEFADEMMGNVVHLLRFLPPTRCGISAQLEFIASYFYYFFPPPDTLQAMPF